MTMATSLDDQASQNIAIEDHQERYRSHSKLAVEANQCVL